LRESISVKDFGAVGDGVTDDTAAIQAAIDAVYGMGGGRLLFPSGTYKVSASSLTLRDKVQLSWRWIAVHYA
jgi:Endopolygalacturonase